jgi:hypothetical protein
VEEAGLACLILVSHTVIAAVILTCAGALDWYRKWLQGDHPHVTPASQVLDFAIHGAESILVIALLLIGTVSAVWTFLKRLRG